MAPVVRFAPHFIKIFEIERDFGQNFDIDDIYGDPRSNNNFSPAYTRSHTFVVDEKGFRRSQSLPEQKLYPRLADSATVQIQKRSDSMSLHAVKFVAGNGDPSYHSNCYWELVQFYFPPSPSAVQLCLRSEGNGSSSVQNSRGSWTRMFNGTSHLVKQQVSGNITSSLAGSAALIYGIEASRLQESDVSSMNCEFEVADGCLKYKDTGVASHAKAGRTVGVQVFARDDRAAATLKRLELHHREKLE